MDIRVKNEKYGHMQVELPNRTATFKKGEAKDVEVCPAIIDRLKTGVLVPVDFYGHEEEVKAMVIASIEQVETALDQIIDNTASVEDKADDNAAEQGTTEIVKPAEVAKPVEQGAGKTGNGKPKLNPLPASNLPNAGKENNPLSIEE